MSGKVWETGLPQLPEGLKFEIKPAPGGTYVRVRQEADYYNSDIPILETYISSIGYRERYVYLTVVWNEANHQANLVKDREERETWIKEAFGSVT